MKLLLAIRWRQTMFAFWYGYHSMIVNMKVELGDLSRIVPVYAEIVGMVGAFYIVQQNPVTPIIIAMTALCRLIAAVRKQTLGC